MGEVVPLFGASNGAAKKKKIILALDGRQLMIYYATTNQKQASTMEGGMTERCNEREAQGKHNAIVLGALLVDQFFFEIRHLGIFIIQVFTPVFLSLSNWSYYTSLFTLLCPPR